MDNFIWYEGSGRIEIFITQKQVQAICHSGANDAAVAEEKKPDIDPVLLKNILSEYGAWDDSELSDHAQNLERIFWIACWDCFDNPENYIIDEGLTK